MCLLGGSGLKRVPMRGGVALMVPLDREKHIRWHTPSRRNMLNSIEVTKWIKIYQDLKGLIPSTDGNSIGD